MTAGLPAPTPPSHRLPGGRAPIELYAGDLEYWESGKLIAASDGLIELALLPSPRYVFTLADARLMQQVADSGELRVPALGAAVPVHMTNSRLIRGPMKGTIDHVSVETGASLTEGRFLVVNFPSFLGEPLGATVPQGGGGSSRHVWAGRLVLRTDEWVVTLDERHDHSAALGSLKTEGGFEVTHTGSLRRVDDQPFGPDDAANMLDALASFLGFAVGAWATPVAPIGLDSNGEIVWREWKARWTSPWRSRMWPLDRLHRDDLAAAFTGYMQRWKDELWKVPLLVATQMYVEANGPSAADTGLILAQNALELISWVRFVEDLRTQGESDFDGLRAADRIRELLAWMEVDPGVPGQLSALAQEASRQSWRDGPHAITVMRNALVHPRRRQLLTGATLAARIELQELALWYVELAFLRLIAFGGEYSNRLGVRVTGAVEPVPWSVTGRSRRLRNC
jgi:hypothetical protein